jgi:hypothetical protein
LTGENKHLEREGEMRRNPFQYFQPTEIRFGAGPAADYREAW